MALGAAPWRLAALLADGGPGWLPISVMTGLGEAGTNGGASSPGRAALPSGCGRCGGSHLFGSRCDRVGPATQEDARAGGSGGAAG